MYINAYHFLESARFNFHCYRWFTSLMFYCALLIIFDFWNSHPPRTQVCLVPGVEPGWPCYAWKWEVPIFNRPILSTWISFISWTFYCCLCFTGCRPWGDGQFPRAFLRCLGTGNSNPQRDLQIEHQEIMEEATVVPAWKYMLSYHMFLWYGPTKIVSSMTPWRQEPKLKMQFSCWRLFHVLEIHISFRCVISLPQMLLLGKASEKPSHQFPSELKDRFYHVNMTMVPELDTWYKENVGHTRKPLYLLVRTQRFWAIYYGDAVQDRARHPSAFGWCKQVCQNKRREAWCSLPKNSALVVFLRMYQATKMQRAWPVLVGSQSHLILCKNHPKVINIYPESSLKETKQPMVIPKLYKPGGILPRNPRLVRDGSFGAHCSLVNAMSTYVRDIDHSHLTKKWVVSLLITDYYWWLRDTKSI